MINANKKFIDGKCPCCHSSNFSFQKFRSEFKQTEVFLDKELATCIDCGFARLNDHIPEVDLFEFYEHGYWEAKGEEKKGRPLSLKNRILQNYPALFRWLKLLKSKLRGFTPSFIEKRIGLDNTPISRILEVGAGSADLALGLDILFRLNRKKNKNLCSRAV